MTEDEAKTKWCPMARVGSDTSGRGSLNRDWAKGPNTHSTQCVASDCMMWRWLPLMADDAFKAAVRKAADEIGDTSNGRHKAAEHVMENRAQYGLPTKPFDGYCGLAGK